MKKRLIVAITGAAALFVTVATPALAKHHAKNGAEHSDTNLRTIITHERRAEDKARDKYRRPAQTLMFFDVQPHHTVVEYGPGGGWYTRILAPLVAEKGTYIAVNRASTQPAADGDTRKPWSERFPGQVQEMTGLSAEKVAAYYGNAIPEETAGTVDRILIFRSMHGLLRRNIADSEIKALRKMLKDDGLLGVVQHRAADDAPYSYTDGSKGYLRKTDIIAMMRLYGFELVKQSDHNANPKDTANYEKGVWTLPPSYAEGDTDKAKFAAIGESDRMTLLFKKLP